MILHIVLFTFKTLITGHRQLRWKRKKLHGVIRFISVRFVVGDVDEILLIERWLPISLC
ncbi:hypothetical protein CTB91_00436 [Dickeya solani]|uniref:Uncharacterized protein n=1 Tax=Dickeya solani D s0432-1 TaxID=1231725 RepID=A0AAV3KGC8_9GAMM|nr:hypothetical protein CTB91_00436 [Dickeya solani]ERO59459.1 hypothetical protein A544_0431 [Dickeya solani D s0432-1]AYQ50463.1 hypothetical protein DSOL99_00441 [Dickeya solani]MBD3604088.1 hypothetical protein [Dickeya solani]NUA38464.1 hypothetical protein [Dickeya solani]